MNIMNRVALNTMKKNRVRTIVTIIGIILSAAMFTAVLTLCTTLYKSLLEQEIEQSGSYHVYARHVGLNDVASVESDARTDYAALLEVLGYAAVPSVNEARPYICVAAADDAFIENMPVHVTEGRLPENANEALIPEHLSKNGGVEYHVGDVLELTLCDRVLASDAGEDLPEGEKLYQDTGYFYEAEALAEKGAARLTVVGVYERPDFEPFFAPGYTVLTHMDEKPADGVYELYLRVINPRKNMDAFASEHRVLTENGYERHESLLTLEGASDYDNINRVLTLFATVLCLLIFAGSVSLIYSAFSISVSERTKQFGLLSSVGATKKQVGRSVAFEALTLSAIGIPIGILAGIGGIALTIWLLRDKFDSVLSSVDITMTLHVTWGGILGAALIALVTVLVSAWIPSIRAKRISPIEAIRQTRDVKAKNGSSRYPKLYAKLFGAEGMLAKKYYKRSRKKYRATIISLAMSVILFIAASSFCSYLSKSAAVSGSNAPSYDGAYGFIDRDDLIRLRGALAESTTEFSGIISESLRQYYYAPDANTTKEFDDFLKAYTDGFSYSWYDLDANVCYVDDVSFREALMRNGVSPEGFFDPEHPKALVSNHATWTDYRTVEQNGSYTRERVTYDYDFLKPGTKTIKVSKPMVGPTGFYAAEPEWSGGRYGEGELTFTFMPSGNAQTPVDENGDPIDLTVPLEFEEIEIGALIEEDIVGGWGGKDMDIFFPLSVYTGDITNAQIYFRSNDVPQSIESMKRVLDDAGIAYDEDSFYDVTEAQRQSKSIVTIIKVFSYGFIALISLICVANVFNTISTNVALRRRDYAMLRSMGMTQKGMNRMSDFECLIYGSRSLLIGLPIALALSFLTYKVASDASIMKFELPWTAIIIAVVSVFVVVFASMLYSTGKLKRDNPIDALKDENI